MNEITKRPMISILMAVYNTEEFLPTAIDSVIEQTYGQWELICVNDGSTDNSLRLLNQYKGKDPRIIVIDRPHCGTCAGTRNTGLAIARGTYITILDSDDKIEPTYLEKLVTRQQQTQADIVISSLCFWDYLNNKIYGSLTGLRGDVCKILSGRESFTLSLHWQIGGIGLHRADILKQLTYNEIGWVGDEYTTHLLFLRASRVAFCNANYFYRNNPNSITKKFSFKNFSIVTTQAMLLTLIRKNNFKGRFFWAYKEEVFLSVIVQYLKLFKKRKMLSPYEKKIVLQFLTKATIHVGKEFFLPPFSIKIILHIMSQLHTKTVKWIMRYKKNE